MDNRDYWIRSNTVKFFRSELATRFLKWSSIVIFIVYLSYLTYLTFISPLYGREFMHRSVNLIPLKTIIQFLTLSYNKSVILTNIAGNIIAFIPMGFLLPLVSRNLKRFIKVLLVVLLATGTIEIMQYVIGVGISDIDDVILNLLGGMLGYLLNRILAKIVHKVQMKKLM